MYYEGQGISQDYAETLKWLRKAAYQGDANAQNNIGDMYETGKGVELNNTKAAEWYLKAANQEIAAAQLGKARLY